MALPTALRIGRSLPPNMAASHTRTGTAPATPTPDFQSLRIKGLTIALPGPQDTIDPDFAGSRAMGTRHSGLATCTSHLLMICGALIMLCGAVNYAIAADAKRVMILHSFGPQFKPWSDYARAIRAETTRQAKWSIDFSDFSLASARSDDTESEVPLVQYLRALYLKEPLDLRLEHPPQALSRGIAASCFQRPQ